jgi:hypothetical protein
MRLFKTFFGTDRRNRGYKLQDLHPKPRYDESNYYSGKPEVDGYERLAKSDPDAAGRRPNVAGTDGDNYPGPDQSFER